MSAEPTETNLPPDAPTVAAFAYQDFYRAMVEREHMQVTRDETTWAEQPAPLEQPVEVLLNFGCNVRQTPNLQREAVAVFETLGVDFVAVAGQQFCCGKPYMNNGLQDVANRVVKNSVKRMASYRPKRAIQWCSACEMQFHDVVLPELDIQFQSDGLAAFLVERIDELGDDVPWETDVDIKALVHGHLGEHTVRDGHPPIAMQLLQRIPGVQVVGLAQTPALELCDNAGPKIATIGTNEYQAAQAELESYLDTSGADVLVTLYHGCTRELGKFASRRLRVQHYMSVLAQALGVAKPDRFSEYWRLADPRKVMEASRPNWESWGISEDEALRLAHKYFVPSYAVNAPECPCNGQCTRTGALWLTPHGVQRGRTAAKDLV
jgi:Fe-S oxidoreductase